MTGLGKTLHQSRKRFQRAFTLLEVLVSAGIASVVLLAVFEISVFTSRSFIAMGNYADLNQFSRQALDSMTRDIRQAKVVGFYSTNYLIFTNLDGSSFSYGWKPSSSEVYRVTGGVTNIIMTNCDYFCFHIWLRNPTNGNPGGLMFPYSATNQPSLTKLVDVSWRCSRSIMQQKINTESVQTAKIVLRN